MTTRPAIIVPAVPFASQADRESAFRVMRPIMTYCVRVRQVMTDVIFFGQSAHGAPEACASDRAFCAIDAGAS